MDIIRAWKDPEYRESLSEAELAAMPAHPAGMIELTDINLGAVVGGQRIMTQEPFCNPDTMWPFGMCWLSDCNPCPPDMPDSWVVVTLAGIGDLDGNGEITHNELQEVVEDLHFDPTLTANEINGIRAFAESLQEHLAPDEWETLSHSINAIEENGALTPEQLENLIEFAEAISAE